MSWNQSAHAGLVIGLGATGLAAVVAGAPGAAASTATVDYACTSRVGASTMSVRFDAPYPEPPAVSTITLSDRHDGRVVVHVDGAVPGALAQAAVAEGATTMFVGGSIDLTKDYDPTGGSPNLVSGEEVALGDQTTATNVPFVQGAVHWLVEPGLREVRAGNASFAVTFRDAVGAPVWGGPVALTCSVATPPVIDTFVLQSTSEVALAMGGQAAQGPDPVFAYGERVPVEASVRVRGARPAAGWVDFSLGGRTERVPLDVDGAAHTTFPGPADRTATNPVVSDTNFVTATYVPADPRAFTGSASYPRLVPVTFAPTKPRIRLIGTRADRVTRAKVRVVPAFESTPRGKVRIDVLRLGTRKHWTRAKRIDQSSRTVARFGELRPGRYRVVVKYRGDGDHLGSKATRRFRVRR